ncbi:M1 family metallopeptidase [Risungbinella massiliensis]|uniref:M1 family metallopeptidase n=1 Tax=Risungbinella massiliensis TaxID=1329796 RepID=UPI0005CC1B35|nr:M1 family metallopeptidase [Risungbinella massiliensis]
MKRFACTVFLIMALFSSTLQLEVLADPVQTARPKYEIQAKYDASKQTVSGHMVVTIPEMRLFPQKEAFFQLYPNVFKDWKYEKESKPEKPGYLNVKNVQVDGVTVKENVKETILQVPFGKEVPIGKTARIEMDYELVLPKGGTRLNTYENTAFLAQWYPMLVVQDKEGWHNDPYTTVGDPFYTQMSDFEVSFDLPAGYQVISSAKDQASPAEKMVLKQDNVRDFVAVLTKDYQVIRGKSGKTDVNLWYLKGMEKESKPLHEAALSSMKFFGERFGEYPYEEVDVVLGETGFGIAGMEYPGLITSIAKMPTMTGETPAISVVAHELAHQWWYGVVGSNQAKEPWLDEGLTTFSEHLFMQKQMKEDDRDWLKKASDKTDEIHKAVGIHSAQKLYDYPNEIYGIMVYIRPAAMMYQLMDDIGEEKVMEILKTYYERYQFQTATSQDFFKVANEVSGKDLKPFFDKWLYFKDGEPKKTNTAS